MLGEYCVLLTVIFLQVDIEDRWSWQLTPDKGYTVSGVNKFLTAV